MIGAFALVYMGLTGLCLGMRRHHGQDFRTGKAPPMKMFGIAGWCLLAVSLVITPQSGNWAINLVEWIGFILAGALAIVLSLAFMPRLCLVLPLCAFLVQFAV